MIRKLALTVAAIAALGTASFALPAPASAKGFGGGGKHFHGGHVRGGFGLLAVDAADDCYTKEVVVVNRRGQVIGVRTVNVCD